jgi:capsular polysaccharide biosynthesis protein
LTGGDVYRALWRHKFFIAVLTAVFVGAAWYVTSRQTRRYEASTLVRVLVQGSRAGDASAALVASQTLTQTYAQIVDAGALKPGIKTLVAGCNSGQPARLKAILPVASAPSGTPSAGGGVPLATRSARRAAAARRSLRKTYASACRSLGITRRVPAPPTKVSKVHLSASPVQDLDLLSIGARSRSRRHATIAANAAPWALRAFIRRSGSRSEKIVTVKAATTPTSPVSRQLPLKLTIALMLGLIFNGALAMLIELFRDRLPEPDQLGREVGVPVLATIPALRLHQAASLAAVRQEADSVSLAQSRDGERSTETTGPRVGPEP